MIKWAKISNPDTGICDVGLGTNSEFYASIGMTEMDVFKTKWSAIDATYLKAGTSYFSHTKPNTSH